MLLLAIFSFLLMGTAISVVFAAFEWSIAGYVATGLAWVLYDRQKNFQLRPFPRSFLFEFATWPIRWVIVFQESVERHRNGERFIVSRDQGEGSSYELFAPRHQAFRFARRMAAQLKEDVAVFDSAKFRKKMKSVFDLPHNSKLEEAMYFVAPSGKVRRLFSSWR